MSDDGVLDQSDIERLLGGTNNTSSGGNDPPQTNPTNNEGTINQSDLDALFNNNNNTDKPSTEPNTGSNTITDGGTISQSDLDALFNNSSDNPPNQTPPTSPPTPPQTKSSASGPLDQNDLNALFQESNIEETESETTPGPIDQAALDVLFGSSTKPTTTISAPTFVPTPTFDPTQPSKAAMNNSGYSSGVSGGVGIGGGGGGFGSPVPDMGGEDNDGVPNGDLEYLLNRAEKSIQSIATERLIPTEVIEFQFPEFGGTIPSAEHATLDQISEVELNVKIELGRTDMYLEDVLKLRKGSVVPLDKTAGDPVDIYVNGRLLARGEVLVMNENFCVRVAELLAGAIPME
jgi:flagellar motor switch protein FliN/FliY